jgi:hypothetical protein
MMERTVLMIRPEQRMQLVRLAEQQDVSVAEINRRAIDRFIDMPDNNYEELNMLASALIKSNAEAKKALQEAELAISKTIKALASKKIKDKK